MISGMSRARLWPGVGLLAACACNDTNREPVRYPPDALPVRFESATSHSGCLVAGVVMASNYLLEKREFSEAGITEELEAAGLDETVVRDLASYLATKGLDLRTLTGEIGDDAPLGLGHWVKSWRYPVICIINRDPEGDTDFNHAVVVIGISPNPEGSAADNTVHYFDPASEAKPLRSVAADAFEVEWGRGGRAMMIVTAPAAATQAAGGTDFEETR